MGEGELCAAVLRSAIVDRDWRWIDDPAETAGVKTWCELTGINLGVYRRKAQEVRDLIATGVSLKEAAAELGCKTERLVAEQLEAMGVTVHYTPCGDFVAAADWIELKVRTSDAPWPAA